MVTYIMAKQQLRWWLGVQEEEAGYNTEEWEAI